MEIYLLLIITILVGMVTPLQAGVNAFLGKHLNSAMQAGFISFLGGFLIMTVCCLLTKKMFPTPSQLIKVPPYLLMGGLLGAIFVVSSIIIAPKIGATVYIACVVTGQLVASIIMDHYGWLGFSMHPINLWRIIGVLFLLIGVMLIRNF